ncbi:MAG: aminotransferase class V-fold PLP-dependent enzyme [bacterium]|nr:aminotransferase class V-fold PLP-dependent enzyme [bacterium]
MIYLDNAGTTKVSKNVKEAMLPYFDEIYGNASSLHTFGQIAKEHLESARGKVAKLIGAEPNEIYFTSGGSEINFIRFGANKFCNFTSCAF